MVNLGPSKAFALDWFDRQDGRVQTDNAATCFAFSSPRLLPPHHISPLAQQTGGFTASLILSCMWFFNIVIQGGQVDRLGKLEPLKAGKLMSRLGSLQKQCGQLCDLEKPVLGGEDQFMGRVKAKVTKLPSLVPKNKSLVPKNKSLKE